MPRKDKINLASYLGKDISKLPRRTLETIINASPRLHGSPDGYVLVGMAISFKMAKDGSLTRTLQETDWVFHGSRATQAKAAETKIELE